MNGAQWDRIKEVFNAAIQQPASERSAFLQNACGPDSELRKDVESLLNAVQSPAAGALLRTGGAVRDLLEAPTASVAPRALSEKAGTTVGPYKILQLIGEGGFGTVFLADQAVPVRRRVALKIIKLGMDTRQVVARFEAERQALALMDHPNIAKVLDAGATDSGRPFFVMEYVKGDPITVFADAHNLTVRERLQLLAQVCQAVQHAHHKGIIHRDIKPSNVLVSMLDGRPHAKVIDFGIAKATGASGGTLTDKTLFTEHHALIGTPEYMSPEQAEGSPDIDTRTDVYGLGVLMYELLTGTTPFDPKRLRSAAFAEIQRIIKEEDPPSPSLRISRDVQRDLGQLASTAARRKVEPQKLNAIMRGELDWMVMKALDKDRARRFATPQEFASDIQRYLSGEAIVAAPPSAAYRMRKFVRRHKVPVAALSAVLVSIAAGTTIALWQWRRAALASIEATAQKDAVQTTLTTIFNAISGVDESTRFVRSVTVTAPDGTKRATIVTNGSYNQASPSLSVRGAVGRTGDNGEFVEQAPAEADFHASLALISELALEQIEGNARAKEAAEWSAYSANIAAAQTEMAAGNWPEARLRLSACPPRCRGWEWNFFDSMSRTVEWSKEDVSWVYFSPDSSKMIAVNHADARLLESTTGKELLVLRNHTRSIDACDFAPDGKSIVTADANRLYHSDLMTGESKLIDEFWPGITDVLVTPDGRELLVAHSLDVSILALGPDRTWLKQGTISPGVGSGASPVMSRTGNRVLTRLGLKNQIWDTKTRQPIGELSEAINSWPPPIISDDGSRIVAPSPSGELRVFDGETGVVIQRLRTKVCGSCVLDVNPTATLAMTASDAGFAYRIDLTNDLDGLLLPYHCTSTLFSRNGAFVFLGDSDGHAMVVGSERGEPLSSLSLKDGEVYGQFSPDGSLVAAISYYPQGARDKYEFAERGALSLWRSDAAHSPDMTLRSTDSLELDVLAESGGGLSPRSQSLVTADGKRRLAVERGTLRWYECKDGKPTMPNGVFREVCALQSPTPIEAIRITENNDRIVLELAGGKRRMLDVRPSEARRIEAGARWRERESAIPYVAHLWGEQVTLADGQVSPKVPTDELLQCVDADRKLSKVSRLVVTELIEENTAQARRDALGLHEELIRQFTLEKLDAAFEAAERLEAPLRTKIMVKELLEGYRPRIDKRP